MLGVVSALTVDLRLATEVSTALIVKRVLIAVVGCEEVSEWLVEKLERGAETAASLLTSSFRAEVLAAVVAGDVSNTVDGAVAPAELVDRVGALLMVVGETESPFALEIKSELRWDDVYGRVLWNIWDDSASLTVLSVACGGAAVEIG